jgi:iron-sulfur cluster assembly protein
MIELTTSALAAVRGVLERAEKPSEGLRIMARGGGCAGLRYAMGLETRARDGDVVVDQAGVKLFIDADSQRLVAGLVVDFVAGHESSGFVFDNPNARSACSCGGSSC